jgi:hypothetical protein
MLQIPIIQNTKLRYEYFKINEGSLLSTAIAMSLFKISSSLT